MAASVTEISSSTRLSFGRKLFSGCGEIAGVLGYGSVGILYVFFLTDVAGISPALAGSVFMLARVWDAVSDPLMGMISDRTRTKWGRRRPFFLIASVPLGLSFFLIWFPFSVADELARVVVYTIVFVMFMTAATTYAVPYLSYLVELTDDYHERTSVYNFRMSFSLVFGLAAAVVPKLIVDSYADKQTGFVMMGLYIGAVMTALALLMFIGTRERYGAQVRQERLEFVTELKQMFRNPAFPSLAVLFVGGFGAVHVIQGFVLYYLKYWLDREADMPILFVTVVLFAVLSLPLWAQLSRRVGKKNTLLAGLTLWGIAQFGWLVINPGLPSYTLYVFGAVVGLGFGCVHVLPYAMVPDVVDMDELNTGRRREGVYTGVLLFLYKVGNSIGMFLIGIALQVIGYVPNVAQQGTALEGMRLIMAFAPFAFLMIGLLGALLSPMTRERCQEVRAALNKRAVSQEVFS